MTTPPTLGPSRTARPTAWQILHSSSAMRVARLTTFAAAVGVGASAWGIAHVRGQLGEAMLAASTSVMTYANAERPGEVRMLRFNGQSLFMRSETTHDDQDAVLDAYEQQCNAAAASIEAAAMERAPNRWGPGQHLAIREDSGRRRVVACLDFREQIDVTTFWERLRRFSDSHDLADLGDVRYVVTEPMSEGGTHYVTFWSEGHFDLDAITGDGGNVDVPGIDLREIPRPPRSLRFIDFEEAGIAEHVLGYQGSSMSGWELEAFYREAFTRAGYRVSTTADPRPRSTGVVVTAERNGQTTSVLCDSDASGHGRAILFVPTGDE